MTIVKSLCEDKSIEVLFFFIKFTLSMGSSVLNFLVPA